MQLEDDLGSKDRNRYLEILRQLKNRHTPDFESDTVLGDVFVIQDTLGDRFHASILVEMYCCCLCRDTLLYGNGCCANQPELCG